MCQQRNSDNADLTMNASRGDGPLTHADPFRLEARYGADGAYREEGEEELGPVSNAEDRRDRHGRLTLVKYRYMCGLGSDV